MCVCWTFWYAHSLKKFSIDEALNNLICIMTECNNSGRSVTEMFVFMNYVWVEFFKIALIVLKTCMWHFDRLFNYLNFDQTYKYVLYVLSIRWAISYLTLLIGFEWLFPKMTKMFFKQYNITMILFNDISIHENILQQYLCRCTWMVRSKWCKHLHVLYSTTTIYIIIIDHQTKFFCAVAKYRPVGTDRVQKCLSCPWE